MDISPIVKGRFGLSHTATRCFKMGKLPKGCRMQFESFIDRYIHIYIYIYNGLSGPSSVILFHISTSEWKGSEEFLCENAIKISGFSDATPCIPDNCENVYRTEKLRFQICHMFLIFLLMRRS
jgi:hypothetical protein